MSPTAMLDRRFFRSEQGNEPVWDWLVLLHGLVKKARTEPDQIALGRERQQQVRKEDKS